MEFGSGVGLRERKKARTRALLIDAAADLCLTQGYDHTTVEQIAAAAEVAPRTFNRYFPTKESVIAAMVAEVDDAAAMALADQPADISEHEAFMRAHLQIFRPEAPSPAFHRMVVLTQIVNASQTLSPFDFNEGPAGRCSAVIAGRMGVPVSHPAVRFVLECGISVLDAVFRELRESGDQSVDAAVVCDGLRSTFAVLARTWQPWNTSAGRTE